MKSFSLLPVLSLFLLTACNSGPTENTGINRKLSDDDTTFNVCYTSTFKKDTILLNGLMYGDSIKGSLGYKLYEKQQQNGSLTGMMHGDTMWGVYTFMTSGSETVNEITFLRSDSLLIEGLGERHLENGKFIFNDKSKITYTGVRLTKTDCRQLPEQK
ncbi:hypothetical protein [Dyadobacter sandarakinus]|uniref:NlpE N-terminal domain-containing protein n=1 Tax=Dyadobacter sandarakinus TaxID=2747268 RepID=A0ABX7I1Y7_9BACT|nr:hypothetical protein [Dyadobacter sandarakinus]QRR00054.1 hypothetical protein HWI92_03560 [Dyadobacter sandarakinus]